MFFVPGPDPAGRPGATGRAGASGPGLGPDGSSCRDPAGRDKAYAPGPRRSSPSCSTGSESLVDASTWADENSRSIPGSAAWHYVNVPISAPRYSPRDCHGDCVVSRLDEFRRVLADPHAPKARRRMALRYVVHLVEDAHQPMHVGDRRDRGGNAVQLQFFRDDATNLHQIWDSGLFRQAHYDERSLASELITLAREPQARDWPGGTVENWINESLEAARQAYRVPGTRDFVRSGMRLGQDYEDANLPLARKRLAQAGVRLSEVLNEAFR